MSTTSRRNDLMHVDSGLSLKSNLPNAIPGSLDKDYNLDNYESQGTLEKIITSLEMEHPTSFISNGESKIDDIVVINNYFCKLQNRIKLYQL